MKLTITEKDQAKAERYTDNKNCLVATMLKRRGHEGVSALPGLVMAGGKTFDILNSVQVQQFYNANGTRVRKSAIGKKIELVEV